MKTVATPAKAVFISYASQDATVAAQLCDSLRAAGLEVWFDQEKLRGGDIWDRQIRERIRDCALFLPLISSATQARLEGYFRREWRLAAERSFDMAEARPFLLPVTIDDTSDHGAQVPDAFLKVQWTRLPGGEVTPAFIERTRQLLGRVPDATFNTADSRTATRALTAPTPEKVSRVNYLVAGLLLLLAIAAGVVYLSKGRHAGMQNAMSGEKSIAVLPFTDMSERKDQEFFSDGIAEEILDTLVKVPALKVIARTSSFQFKGRNEDVRRIGELLGARYVVEGSVRRTADRVRITAQLIAASEGAHVWSQTYERPITDVLDMQRDIATGIARALQVSVNADEWPNNIAINPTAYEHYLRGKLEADRWTLEGWERAQIHFQSALEADPDMVAAAVAASGVYAVMLDYGYGNIQQEAQKAREMAKRALQISPNQAFAHALIGDVAGMVESDWNTAQREINKALQLEPGNALIVSIASKVAIVLGRSQDAVTLTTRAIELDPLFWPVRQLAEYAYSCTGRYTEAEASIRQGLRISPELDSAHMELAMLLIAQGRTSEAMNEARLETNDVGRQLGIAMAQDALDNRAGADATLAAAQGVGDSDRAVFYARRGDLDQAFRLLNEAIQHPEPSDVTNLPFVKCHIMWAPLRRDPRYASVLERLKLNQ